MAGTDEFGRSYLDGLKGSTHRHLITEASLSRQLQTKINEADFTVHELMELNIIEDKITNLHLMKLSGTEIKAGDV